MNILEVRDLIYMVPHKILCDKISFTIAAGEKVALLAKNGAGKSTLLELIAGKKEPYAGEIDILPRMRVGYLAQNEYFAPEATVLDTIFSHDSDIGQLIKQYEHYLAIGRTDGLEHIVQRIGALDGRDYETKVRIVINKLQLGDLLEQSIQTCSGGERKRIALAKLLIDDPDFLILDEPTNHLDISMIAWLESYLAKSNRTVLLVTHDRYFLERICNRIIELDQGDIYNYPGNYTAFLAGKAKREEQQEQERHELKQFLKKEYEWMVKAPRARESKSIKREKDYHTREKEYAAMKRQALDHKKRLDISLVKRRIGGKVLRLHKVRKSFGDKTIVHDFSYDFRAGERVGLIGPNGVGKSTFIRLLLGKEAVDSGTIKKGETITMGWYQQEQRPLDPTKKVLDIVKDVAEYIFVGGGKRLSAAQILERFMFLPKQQHQKASLLSGGEQRRLALLLTLLENPNFLILDEPTNDLDIMTLAMLEDFLLTYTGCLLVISHDRMFVDRVVDHVFVFEGDGIIVDFPGGYSDRAGAQQTKEKSEEIDLENTGVQENKTTFALTQQAQRKTSLSNKERERYRFLGEEIERLEERKEEINLSFAHDIPHDEIHSLSKELVTITETLEQYEHERLLLAERT